MVDKCAVPTLRTAAVMLSDNLERRQGVYIAPLF